MTRRITFKRLRAAEQPLLYAAVFLTAGMVMARQTGLPARLWAAVCLVSLAGAVICRLLGRGMWAGLICIWLGTAGIGGWLWSRYESRSEGAALRGMISSPSRDWEAPVEIHGLLSTDPEPAPDRVYLSLEIEMLSSFRLEDRVDGKVRIVVPLPDARAEREFAELGLRYGTRVRLLGHLRNPRIFRNPGSIDLEALLERQGYDAAGAVKSPLLIEHLGEGGRNPLLAALYGLRSRALAALIGNLDQPAKGILAAALLGNRYFLTKQTGELFREGGTYHMLVISGLHIGVIAAVVLLLAGAASRRRSVRFAITISVIWAYAVMVGAQPAVTRAAVMLTIVLIGRIIFRESAGANSVAASAIVLLVWNPGDLFNPAFQLSILTVLTIVVMIVPFYLRLQRIGRWRPTASTPYPPNVAGLVRLIGETLYWDEAGFRAEMRESPVRFRLKKFGLARLLGRVRLQRAMSVIFVTMLTATGIQIGLLPLMVGLFHRVSIISPLANVVEGLFMLALMAAGAVFLIAQAVIGPSSRRLAPAIDLLGETILGIGEPLQAWSWVSIRPPDFGEAAGWLYAGYFAGLIVLAVALNEWNPLAGFRKRGRFSAFAIASGLISAAILGIVLVSHPFPHRYDEGRLSVTFLDVGQGDSMLISFPKGKLMLLDSGGRVAYRNASTEDDPAQQFEEDRLGVAEAALLPHLWFRGIGKIDWIVASHGDADHIEAFDELIEAMRVGAAWYGKDTSADGNAFLDAVSREGIPLRRIGRGDRFEIDGVGIEILWPDPASERLSENDRSLVLRLRYGRRSILLTGDIEASAETRLAEIGDGLRADVLKTPHHGSKTSSTTPFLDAVRPHHAIISAGRPSPFGHPHPVILDRLESRRIRIWETGRCGAVTASTDGEDLRVESHVRCESDGRSVENARRSSRAQ